MYLGCCACVGVFVHMCECACLCIMTPGDSIEWQIVRMSVILAFCFEAGPLTEPGVQLHSPQTSHSDPLACVPFSSCVAGMHGIVCAQIFFGYWYSSVLCSSRLCSKLSWTLSHFSLPSLLQFHCNTIVPSALVAEKRLYIKHLMLQKVNIKICEII